MLKKSTESRLEVRNNVRGGSGDAAFHHIWSKGTELNPNMRLCARIVLEPGCSIGYHIHEKEDEIYYILSGTAETGDNGEVRVLHPGDSTLTRSGEGHSILCKGPEKLEILAVIVAYS
ncbi:MAG: Cupin domain protein [Lentisphaerae bacterium ADurb.Bin242]|nr:MAG: Cupin domain protein [Lentisphaerae bacterium ADurb.Bin242]